MSGYIFRQRCRPTGDFRTPEIVEFLHLIMKALRCSVLYDSRGKPVDIRDAGLRSVFEKAAQRLVPGLGADEDFFTIAPQNRDKNTVRIEIHTGTHPKKQFIDTYNISMSEGWKVPAFEYLKRSIGIFRPFEAFLAEDANETILNSFDRQQLIPKFDKPAIIRGFHYLDEFMARSIGGISYCLKVPAWRVEPFCQGVLMQLVPGLFDSSNPEHLRIQQEAMKYFHL